MVWPAIIGAGAALIGGAMSNRSNSRQAAAANAQSAQQAAAANALSESQHRENIALQREFAQQSIQWRTADAKAAGLHPLYALGASGSSYSPSTSTFHTAPYSTYSDSMGPALAAAGQQIAVGYSNRARQKRNLSDSNFMRNMAQNEMILNQQRLKAEINRTNLESAMFQQSINARARQFGNSQQDLGAITDENTPIPSGKVQGKPSEITSSGKGTPYKTAGRHPGWMEVDVGPFNALAPSTDEGWGEDLGLTKLGLMAAATIVHKVYKVAKKDIYPYIRRHKNQIQKDMRYRRLLRSLGKEQARPSGVSVHDIAP